MGGEGRAQVSKGVERGLWFPQPPSLASGAPFLSWAGMEGPGTGCYKGKAKGEGKNICHLALTLQPLPVGEGRGAWSWDTAHC